MLRLVVNKKSMAKLIIAAMEKRMNNEQRRR